MNCFVNDADELASLLSDLSLGDFYTKLRDNLQVTRLAHFSDVEPEDLAGIGMGKPAIRRLFKAVGKATTVKQHILAPITNLLRRHHQSSSGGGRKIDRDQLNNVNKVEETSATCLILSSELAMLERLGEGNFGVVEKAFWRRPGDKKGQYVAVKILNNIWEEKHNLKDFLSEISVMHRLDHPNLVKLHGVCFDKQQMLVTELASFGSLLEFVKTKAPKIAVSKLLSYAVQLASALEYLETNRFIHRDIALRNVFLATEETIKLGDFGLACLIPQGENFMTTNGQKLPFAWAAPESLQHGKFSHASDTWMYGIAVWEIFSFGGQPWKGMQPQQVLDAIVGRQRPEKPFICPNAIFQVLLQCWRTDPNKRPTFAAIVDFLTTGYFLEVKAKRPFADTKNDHGKLKIDKGDKILVIEGSDSKRWWFGQNLENLEYGYFQLAEVQLPSELQNRDSSGSLPGTFSSVITTDKLLMPNCICVNDDNSTQAYLVPTTLPTRSNHDAFTATPGTGWQCEFDDDDEGCVSFSTGYDDSLASMSTNEQDDTNLHFRLRQYFLDQVTKSNQDGNNTSKSTQHQRNAVKVFSELSQSSIFY